MNALICKYCNIYISEIDVYNSIWDTEIVT